MVHTHLVVPDRFEHQSQLSARGMTGSTLITTIPLCVTPSHFVSRLPCRCALLYLLRFLFQSNPSQFADGLTISLDTVAVCLTGISIIVGASVYSFLKDHGLITSPAFFLMKAADRFANPTTAPSQLWQTDFTYRKVIGWG
jgi:hypothetical protein